MPGTHTQCSILIVATVTVEYAVTPKLTAAVMYRARGGSSVPSPAGNTSFVRTAALLLLLLSTLLRTLKLLTRDGPPQGPASPLFVLPSSLA